MLWCFGEVSLRLTTTLLPSPRRITHHMHPFRIKTLVSLWFWRGYDLPNTNYYASCNTWVHMTGAPFSTLTGLAAARTESPAGIMGLLIILQLLIGGTRWDHSLLSDVLISLTAVFPMANYNLDALLMFSIWQLRTWVGKMEGLSKHQSSPHKITQVAPSQPWIPFALSCFFSPTFHRNA